MFIAAMNIYVQVFEYVFNSLGYEHRSRIAESFDNSMFNFLNNYKSVFHSNPHQIFKSIYNSSKFLYISLYGFLFQRFDTRFRHICDNLLHLTFLSSCRKNESKVTLMPEILMTIYVGFKWVMHQTYCILL